MLPAVEAREVVGAHDPDEGDAGAAALQPADGVIGVARADGSLDAGDDDAGMGGDAPGGAHPALERGQGVVVLERVAGRHQPPDAIEAEAAQGGQRGAAMALMRRVEAAAEQADRHSLGEGGQAREGRRRAGPGRRGPAQTEAMSHSRMSTKRPAMAAAAAICGETRWVRPLWPWRPSKLRFEVEAQRSPGESLSAFMARHMEQPGSRQSKPAALKIWSRPSSSACSFTSPEPGTTMA